MSTSSSQRNVLFATVGALVGLGAAAALLRSEWLGKLLRKRKGELISVIGDSKWFSEISELWVGQAFSLEVQGILEDRASKYQRIQVLDCGPIWGKVLVLDGAIQLTEKDQHAYHEMLSHIPMLSHPNPQRVLVVGGGDGGIVTELCKHPGAEFIQLCEIDVEVVNVARQHFPTIARGFDDPRVHIHIGDGFQFLRDYSTSKQPPWDVIIVDSSDPIGPANVLFSRKFYQMACQSLSPRGILCCQGECIWLHARIISNMVRDAKTFFPVVEYCHFSVPSYPCGNIGIMCCNKSAAGSCKRPLRELGSTGLGRNDTASTSDQATDASDEKSELSHSKDLLYYSKSVHSAAFVLPPFAQNIINGQQTL